MTTLPPTRKLYWADPYRRQFTARVLARHPGPRPSLALNRTLFYPEGGGQPHDLGQLGGAQVLAVNSEQDLIHHYVDHLPTADEVSGEIDWPRRWDHMQQHSGQHLLSAACLDLLDRPTIGFHLSPDSVTIDLPGSPPPAAALDQVLDFTQAIIAENRPITSAIYPAEAIPSLPLRKPPTVYGPVRVVEIADIDWSACGGTHVAATAAIGSVIITRVERRGADTRIHFALRRPRRRRPPPPPDHHPQLERAPDHRPGRSACRGRPPARGGGPHPRRPAPGRSADVAATGGAPAGRRAHHRRQCALSAI